MKSALGICIGWMIVLVLLGISGCGGSGSSAPPPPPADTTPPTVSSVQAPAGTTVNRSITLTVTADDNIGVTEVRFFVDGVLLGSDDTAPYSIEWDTSSESDGEHELTAEAEDAEGNVGESGNVIVNVRNVVQFAVAASGEEEVPPVESAGTAQADLMINLASGEVSGELRVSGLPATAAHIHDAFAGTNGPVIIGLDQDNGDPSQFTVPTGATLDAEGVDRLLRGALYVNVHTAAAPGGEVRGQILPEDLVLQFSELAGTSAVPRTDSVARGRAAVTLNQATGVLVVQAQLDNLDDATQAHVGDGYAGASGPALVSLVQDPTDSGHWSVEDGELNGAGLDAFNAGRLFVSVDSPANPSGEIRGQILPDEITLLSVELSGEQEVPEIDTNAAGLASLTLDENDGLLTVHVNTTGLEDASDAHLHGAFAGVNGPVEIGLVQDGSNPAHWFAEEEALSAAQLDAVLAGATYINVHSPSNPDGEIRGQVIPDGILFAFGRLEGRQEVPAVDTMATGTFAVTVDPVAATLVAYANTRGVDDAVAAHLHNGFAGTSGSVVIGLTQDANTISRWSAENEPLNADQLEALRAGRYYVNVHTPANPGGEIRGQVAPSPIEVLFTRLSGGEEVPAVISMASGVAASTVNRETGAVTLHLRASGVDDAVAAHIHSGYAGQTGGVAIGLQQDPLDVGHWLVEQAQLNGDGLADYLAGRAYVNLHTPANPGGELRGQLAPRNIQIVFSVMDGDQVVPPVVIGAGGLAATTTHLGTRRLVAFINASGVDDGTSASIHSGGLGNNGGEVLTLTQTPMAFGQWSVVSEQLDAASYADYRAGRLYAQIATPAQPEGAIRGQITPPDAIDFDDQAPMVSLVSPGSPVSGTIVLMADASDDQGVAEVRFFADGVLVGLDGTAPYSAEWDTTTVMNGDILLSAEAEDLAGNLSVSADVVVTVDNAAPVTLADIQAQVFSPICSGCHSGPTSNVLPAGMNLSNAAASHAALVNVASLQVAGLDRVTPGDPDNSYLIQKLEGTAAVGSRMPQGGPFLDQPTIDMIRQWIADGAPNN